MLLQLILCIVNTDRQQSTAIIKFLRVIKYQSVTSDILGVRVAVMDVNSAIRLQVLVCTPRVFLLSLFS